MENNSNAIAEIQKKYAGCNLLMPAATEVQLNPFYKITVMEVTADLSENSGDIFKVGSVKTGTTQQISLRFRDLIKVHSEHSIPEFLKRMKISYFLRNLEKS